MPTALMPTPRSSTTYNMNAQSDSDKVPTGVISVRHEIVERAIEGILGKRDVLEPAAILPINPEHTIPRMVQQQGAFTLHTPSRTLMEFAIPDDVTMYRVPKASKKELLRQLRRMGTDYFTVFHDLDNLSRELRVSWDLYPNA